MSGSRSFNQIESLVHSTARRFDQALHALRQGDGSMLASPLKDCYHQVWFEYHEDLITLSGRDRVAEESQDHNAGDRDRSSR